MSRSDREQTAWYTYRISYKNTVQNRISGSTPQTQVRTPATSVLFALVGTFLIRDGSYGLLGRPIRINTLLIRHTRIIRKRIFAILGGTLGCTNHPPTTTNCPSSLQNIIMPPGKDPEWHLVVVMGQKGQIYEMPMPDAGCQNSEISAAVPPASANTS